MTNLLERAINCDGDLTAEIIQDALGVEAENHLQWYRCSAGD